MAVFVVAANIEFEIFVAPIETPPTLPLVLLLLLLFSDVGTFVTDSGGVSGGFQPP